MSIRILPSSTLRYKLIYPTTIIFKFSKARKKHCIRKKKNTVFRKKTCEKTKTAFFWYTRKETKRKNEWFTVCSLQNDYQPHQAEPNQNNLQAHSSSPYIYILIQISTFAPS